MKYKVIIFNEKIFLKDLSKIWNNEKEKIFWKIEKLKIEGIKNSQIKRLKNYPVADFRLRAWEYRLLFNISLEKWEIYIFRILHRSKLY